MKAERQIPLPPEPGYLHLTPAERAFLRELIAIGARDGRAGAVIANMEHFELELDLPTLVGKLE